jgi:N-sulfoglucosamine sulfohydrolase
MNGRSIVPLLEGKKQPDRDRVYVVYDRAHGDVYETRAIHTRQYGYIYNHWANGKNLFRADNSVAILESAAKTDPEIAKRLKFYNYRTREEFYDYSKDSHSLHNLASDPAYDAPLNEMRRAMRDMLNETGDPNASGYGNYVPIKGK